MREVGRKWQFAAVSGTLLAVCVITSTGCGGSAASPSSDISSESTHEETERPTLPRRPSKFSPRVRLETDSEQEDGSSARQRLELGKLSAANDFEAPRGFGSLVGVCKEDDRRDAVVPGRLVIENTTNGFPIEVDSGVIVGLLSPGDYPGVSPYEDVPLTEVAQDFSSGPSCLETTGTGTTPGDAEFQIGEDETIRHNFLAVVHGYYSPAYPEGDKEGLADLRARISSQPGEAVCVSSTAPLDGDAVRLDGKAISDYHVYDPELPAC